jgi:hypothetical protein
MAIIIVLLSILGSAVFLYFKGTIVRSFACILSAIFACIAAFAYFEPLASFLIKRGTMVPSAYTVSFLLLFVLTFVICLALTLTLTRWPVDFGSLPERRLQKAPISVSTRQTLISINHTVLCSTPMAS